MCGCVVRSMICTVVEKSITYVCTYHTAMHKPYLVKIYIVSKTMGGGELSLTDMYNCMQLSLAKLKAKRASCFRLFRDESTVVQSLPVPLPPIRPDSISPMYVHMYVCMYVPR